ncbi:hypothetical protein [Singulisphaera acidiphila]|uniref:hypothetical protein n=1 Tax=Singulisphaera acidiphila TaxID=466153 RepID=UPI0002D9CA23|nr:hypothetical protein [Singulisphaera acidiphila]
MYSTEPAPFRLSIRHVLEPHFRLNGRLSPNSIEAIFGIARITSIEVDEDLSQPVATKAENVTLLHTQQFQYFESKSMFTAAEILQV